MLVDFVLLSLSGADLGIHNPACVLDRVKSSGRSPADSLTLSSHSLSHSVLGLAHTYRLFLSFPRWLHDTTLSERRRLGAIIFKLVYRHQPPFEPWQSYSGLTRVGSTKMVVGDLCVSNC